MPKNKVESQNDPECGVPYSYIKLSEDDGEVPEYVVESIISHGFLVSGDVVFLTRYACDDIPYWQRASNFLDSDGTKNDVFAEYCSLNGISPIF